MIKVITIATLALVAVGCSTDGQDIAQVGKRCSEYANNSVALLGDPSNVTFFEFSTGMNSIVFEWDEHRQVANYTTMESGRCMISEFNY